MKLLLLAVALLCGCKPKPLPLKVDYMVCYSYRTQYGMGNGYAYVTWYPLTNAVALAGLSAELSTNKLGPKDIVGQLIFTSITRMP